MSLVLRNEKFRSAQRAYDDQAPSEDGEALAERIDALIEQYRANPAKVAEAEAAVEAVIEAREASEGTDGDDAVADELREALQQMREEADRIAALGTGDEQVEAAERFAEAAGKLDEQVGAAARAADENG